MSDDSEDRRVRPGLPVAIEPPRSYLRLPRYTPHADFVSQLIAERQHLPTQRELRRVPIAEAVDAYCAGAERAIRRMPAGYRRSFKA